MAELEQAFRRRELYLICHDGLADDGMIAGGSDIGIRPSPRSHYDRLRKALPTEADVEWYRSPERRCQQTSARVFGEVDWEDSDQLAARAMGVWEGKTWRGVRDEDSVRAESFWSNYAVSKAPSGGESLVTVHERVNAFLTGMGHRTTWTEAVVVCAPEVIAAAVCDTLQVDLSAVLRFNVAPLSLTRLSHSWIGWQVRCVNALSL